MSIDFSAQITEARKSEKIFTEEEKKILNTKKPMYSENILLE